MQYYYTDGVNRFGPMSVEKLMICDINANTLVWCEGMSDWIAAGEVAEIAEILKGFPPPIPSPATKESEAKEPQSEEQSEQRSEQQSRSGSTPPLTAPKSWLVESILVTIFCCLPLGIVATIYAWQVEDCYMSGDYDGALKFSNRAKNWCKYALIIGLALWAIPLLLLLFLGFTFIPAIISFFSIPFWA